MRQSVPVPANNNMLLLHSQLSLVELLMYCVDMGHMSILVGVWCSHVVHCMGPYMTQHCIPIPHTLI